MYRKSKYLINGGNLKRVRKDVQSAGRWLVVAVVDRILTEGPDIIPSASLASQVQPQPIDYRFFFFYHDTVRHSSIPFPAAFTP